MLKNKVLFILKRKQNYDNYRDSHIGMSTGLYNSASFMNDMLRDMGIDSHIEVVVDGNGINKEVTQHRPTHVIIEALWVTPAKFFELIKIHPKVKWIVRLHSEIPFLANEGIAMDWIGDYIHYENITIATNAPRAATDIRVIVKAQTGWSDEKVNEKIIYLPNYYPQKYKQKEHRSEKHTINIACFGAIRPMKNHLEQAIAAIKFAESIGKKLRFHINAGRVEQKGEAVLNNLKALFEHLHDSGHELINHSWMPRHEFLKVCARMDIGMQVSLSETFNIVAADIISQGVPLVGSPEIPWSVDIFNAKPTNATDMSAKLWRAYNFSKLNTVVNQYLLTKYTNKSRKIWHKYLIKS